MKSPRAEVVTAVLLALVLLGGGLFILKPKFLSGESKRAATSAATTAALETATTAQGASAAASVATIGRANAEAPASPAKDFIAREVPVALAKLPAPDPLELLAAEKRRSAVMEGRAIEANRLYEGAAKHAAQLQTERDRALVARQHADTALQEAAAAQLAAERQSNIFIAVCVVLAIGWGYTKIYSISPASIGSAAAGMRAGEDPIAALSRVTAPWMHARIHTAAKLATDIDAKEK